VISYQVVGHFSRGNRAERLATQVGGDFHIDDGSLGIWGNHMRALRRGVESGATHVCVLEEDAQPVEGFLEALPRAVSARPDDLISLYVGSGRPFIETKIRPFLDTATSEGLRWLQAPHLFWGVGVVIPVAGVERVLEGTPNRAGVYYDNELGRLWGKPVQYVWPSLVDHEDGDSIMARQVGREQPERKAFRTGVASDYNTVSAPLVK